MAHADDGLSLVSNRPQCYAAAPVEAQRDLVDSLFLGRLIYADERIGTRPRACSGAERPKTQRTERRRWHSVPLGTAYGI